MTAQWCHYATVWPHRWFKSISLWQLLLLYFFSCPVGFVHVCVQSLRGFYLAHDNLADSGVLTVSMRTDGSCVSRDECVADAVALPRDWETLINDLLTQINAMVLNRAATESAWHIYCGMTPVLYSCLHFLDHHRLRWHPSAWSS